MSRRYDSSTTTFSPEGKRYSRLRTDKNLEGPPPPIPTRPAASRRETRSWARAPSPPRPSVDAARSGRGQGDPTPAHSPPSSPLSLSPPLSYPLLPAFVGHDVAPTPNTHNCLLLRRVPRHTPRRATRRQAGCTRWSMPSRRSTTRARPSASSPLMGSCSPVRNRRARRCSSRRRARRRCTSSTTTSSLSWRGSPPTRTS
mmetsp:Transcript_68876/g.192395  ORF Transcript_68876/g.192395 Transcript_68876/m.192395 type:complete len:200 (+) Transcript_68876:77-676(+)